MCKMISKEWINKCKIICLFLEYKGDILDYSDIVEVVIFLLENEV